MAYLAGFSYSIAQGTIRTLTGNERILIPSPDRTVLYRSEATGRKTSEIKRTPNQPGSMGRWEGVRPGVVCVCCSSAVLDLQLVVGDSITRDREITI